MTQAPAAAAAGSERFMAGTSPTSTTAAPLGLAWEWFGLVLLALAVMGLAIFVLCSLFATLDQPSSLYPADY